MLPTVFGSSPTEERLERCEASQQFSQGAFHNTELTPQIVKVDAWSGILWKVLTNSTQRTPRVKIPHVMTDLHDDTHRAWEIVWFGHSSYLITNGTTRILVDPVLSGNASPFQFFGSAFAGADEYKPEHMPDVDVMILTHDHYDHLCMRTIRALAPRTTHIVTSLGVGAHLERWGVPRTSITELDWWESTARDPSITITAAPARHFSGRAFKRGETLWSSFILELPDLRLYLGADSGYGTHFQEIGERFDGFDLAIIEAGQYGANWPYIHMLPEQTVQAAHDLRARALFPVHWAKFSLSYHPWDEPIRRVITQAQHTGMRVATPMIGERMILQEELPRHPWWEGLTAAR